MFGKGLITNERSIRNNNFNDCKITLTLSKTTDFRQLQTERVCRRQDNFEFKENDGKFSQRREIPVGKGKTARNVKISCFQPIYTADR